LSQLRTLAKAAGSWRRRRPRDGRRGGRRAP